MATSPIEVINAAITNYNPFNQPAIVTNQDVWDKGFPDVVTLNAHASNAVFRAIEPIIQYSPGKAVTAGLKRLVQYKKFDITRGCIVRSKKINPRWAAQGYLDKLLSKELGGEWVMLKAEEVRPLIAILSVYNTRNDYGLSEEQIFDFIDKTGLAANNPLLKEILSVPSGQIPTDAVDE